MTKNVDFSTGLAQTERDGNGATNATPSLTIANLARRSETMADTSYYRDSEREVNSEQSDNWKPLGPLAEALVRAAQKRREEAKE